MIIIKLGKTLIIGDSYSTFEGYIPKDYDFWYLSAGKESTDVNKVEQTWWYGLFDGKENILLLNESFSGTTICNTVRPNLTVETSFISRLDKLIADGFFEKNKPETVFVFGGTNDDWIGSPIGECQFDDFKKEDLLKALPACGYLASRINEVAPDADICWLINTDFKPELEDGIIKTAKHFSQKYLKFKEISKMSGHPNIIGMMQIQKEIKEFLNI